MRATHRIELEENITTGYSWVVESCSEGLELTDHGHVGNAEAMAELRVGAAGTRVFTITSAGASGRVVLGYRRPWDPADTPAIHTHVVEISAT